MDFIELALSRHSIRSFTQQAVEAEDIAKLLKAAQAAPSGGNCQPWHFFVIRDKSVQKSIADMAGHQPFIHTAPVMFVVCADIPRSEGRYGERGRSLYCIQDTAAAIQNLLLCAASLGLGTCWCGAFDEDAVSEILSLPKTRRPVAIIPVGYPASAPLVPTSRRPVEEIVTFIGESVAGSNEAVPRRVGHCDMGGTAFFDVNLAGSTFNNINFHRVDISDANLSEGKIHDCDLTNFVIYNCKFDGMTINGQKLNGLNS